MIHSLQGKISEKRQNFFTINVGGIFYKIYASENTLKNVSVSDSLSRIFTHLNVKEDALDLYGFTTESELNIFEKLISISGIGPKSAMSVLGLGKIDQIVTAINEGKADLLTRASGVGKKTAERIVLELKGKLDLPASSQTLTLMESDLELEETLVTLGYSKMEAKTIVGKIDSKTTGFKERLKEALRNKKV